MIIRFHSGYCYHKAALGKYHLVGSLCGVLDMLTADERAG